MKVNLVLNGKVIRPTHLNIDPFADGKDLRVSGNIDMTGPNQEVLVCDGEAEEILAYEILDYFPGSQIQGILEGWVKKLAIGGRLVISTVDLEEVSKAVVFGNFKSIQESHELLYGEQSAPWQYKKVCMTLGVLKESLTLFPLGLKILKCGTENFRCYVVAQRI